MKLGVLEWFVLFVAGGVMLTVGFLLYREAPLRADAAEAAVPPCQQCATYLDIATWLGRDLEAVQRELRLCQESK